MGMDGRTDGRVDDSVSERWLSQGGRTCRGGSPLKCVIEIRMKCCSLDIRRRCNNFYCQTEYLRKEADDWWEKKCIRCSSRRELMVGKTPTLSRGHRK